MGTKMVQYYLLIGEGLKDEKTGKFYYTKVALAALEEKRKRAEEEKKKAKARKFKDNGNGTVTDNDTKLMWQQGENDKMSWNSAITYCEGLSFGGYNDWRLPNIDELKSLIDVEEKPTINKMYFPNAYSSYYWASTTGADGTPYVWSVDVNDGLVSYGYRSNGSYVRCVRGGTP